MSKGKTLKTLKKPYAEKFGLKDAPANEDIEAITNQFTKQLEEKDKQIESIKDTYKKESDNKTILESLKNSFSEFEGKTNYAINDLVTIAQSKGDFTVVDGKVFQSKRW